jgi:hypothetical protein
MTPYITENSVSNTFEVHDSTNIIILLLVINKLIASSEQPSALMVKSTGDLRKISCPGSFMRLFKYRNAHEPTGKEDATRCWC